LIISGNNFQTEKQMKKVSYYFSKFTHIWGWATWKDRWEKYDVKIRDWPKVKKSKVLKYDYFLERKYWEYIFDKVYAGEIDTWDYQLLYLSMKNNYLNILPGINLVENIGVGKRATHTISNVGVPKKDRIKFPLKHSRVIRNSKADIYTETNHYKIKMNNILFSFMKSKLKVL
jgi:hypothetical protein